MRQKRIQDIDHGMVFDHLELGTGARIFEVLKARVWEEKFYPIMAGSFESTLQGKKDIAKLHGLHVGEGSPVLNEVAVISPHSTVNWIQDSRVVKKKRASDCMADVIETPLVECANQNCISHEEAPHRFHVLSRQPIRLKCAYCTREFPLR